MAAQKAKPANPRALLFFIRWPERYGLSSGRLSSPRRLNGKS